MAQHWRSLLNIALFQAGWFGCVLLADHAWLPLLVTAVILLCHGLFLVTDPREWWLIVALAATGWLVDGLLGQLGVFDFGGVWLPSWLACLWLLFATTLYHSLSWLLARPLLAAGLAFGSAPLSYLAGSRLTFVTLQEPLWLTLVIIGSYWAILFPLALRMVQWQQLRRAAIYD